MCLALVAFDAHDRYRLIVAANRDEFHGRASAPANYWQDYPNILGGRDLEGGGTWLGVNRRGSFAAITNVRRPGVGTPPRSRGLILNDFLRHDRSPQSFLNDLYSERDEYAGFNFIGAKNEEFSWYSNHSGDAQSLAPGVYGLSNHLLDTPWPKVTRLKQAFAQITTQDPSDLSAALFDVLANEKIAPDHELPDSGIELEYERILSPIFINGENYGTRCSTIVLIDRNNRLSFFERRFGPNKAFLGEQSFEFEIEHGAT